MERGELPRICQDGCTMRVKLTTLNIEQDSTVAEWCDNAAAMMALGGMALEFCPYWQFVRGNISETLAALSSQHSNGNQST